MLMLFRIVKLKWFGEGLEGLYRYGFVFTKEYGIVNRILDWMDSDKILGRI